MVNGVKEQYQSKIDVIEYPERVMMDFHGKCNLKCPMCFVHGQADEQTKQEVVGTMDYDKAVDVLTELSSAGPVIHPELYGEPTVAPKFKEYMQKIKALGMGVAINTNGLTLSNKLAQFLIDLEIDSISFSIDAFTADVLQKVRGVSKLQKIIDNINMMLDLRGDKIHPRISVSYTVQPENEHQVDDFVEYWIQKVDMVRVSGVISAKLTIKNLEPPKERYPCKMLYQSMPIHFNGDALICCLDGLAKNSMGNVFEEGVKAVWHGERYSRVRHLHEAGQWDKIAICKHCTAWAGHDYQEFVEGDVLIRRSPQFVYYNRLDRLESWKQGQLKGHNSSIAEIEQSSERINVINLN